MNSVALSRTRRNVPHGVPRTCRQCGRSFRTQPSDPGQFCTRACYAASQDRPLVDRFWMRVEKTPVCWRWTGARTCAGYGHIRVAGETRMYAHRVAWELAHGPIPVGLFVCHRCDNPACVRAECSVPGCTHEKDASACEAHLFLGTAADNNADRQAKGRSRKGGIPLSTVRKLTPDQVREIRVASESGPLLAARYGVSRTMITLIRRGKARQCVR